MNGTAAIAAAVISLGSVLLCSSRAAFSPRGKRIVTASHDHTARIWEAATGKEIAVLRGHFNSVSSAAFSPDGTRIVTASWDNTARIWDASTGKEIALMREPTVAGAMESAAFSPDGTRIVTASVDYTARIWDAATASEIAVLRGATQSAAVFSPDGTRIVTASGDNTARIWDVHSATMSIKDLITEACARRLRGLTTLSRDEMRIAGYSDVTAEIDVCAGMN
jgi:WD40 repeat protein